MKNGKLNNSKEQRSFTDRESGVYSGLMLSLSKYRSRLEAHHGCKLNKKPRELDCLIIDKHDQSERIINDIASFFERHNIVEFKNPDETLNVETVWKVISYGTQYISDMSVDPKEVTLTLLRVSKPIKALKQLAKSGYQIETSYPGVFYIGGMVDIKMQVVVAKDLRGDDFVPLRIQRRNANEDDCRKFVDFIKREKYSKADADDLECVVKNGIYENEALAVAMEDESMTNSIKRFIEEQYKEARESGFAEGMAQGEAKGEAKGEEQRKKLEAENRMLRNMLKKANVAMF